MNQNSIRFREGEEVSPFALPKIARTVERVAAPNMVGKPTAFTEVPFFWTTQFDATLNYVGHAYGWDVIIANGSLTDKDFLAFYVKNGLVTAVAGMNHDRDLAYIEELLRLDRIPSPQEIKNGIEDFSRFFDTGQKQSQASS